VRRARSFRRSAIGLIAVVATAVTGCSSSGGKGSGTSGPAQSPASGSTSVDLAALSKKVTQAAAAPDASSYLAGYGDTVSDPGGLRGKKLMIIPGNSHIPACAAMAQADAALARAAGMTATVIANGGTTAEHNAAVKQAITSHYDAINTGCDFDPKTAAPAITQASAAGIPVIAYGATQQEAEAGNLKIAGYVFDTWALDGEIAADQAVVQHDGKPFQAIAITSNEVPTTAIMQGALKAELTKTCPKCTVTDVDVPVADWTSKIPSAVTSALLRNKNATVLFPTYSSMLPPMLQGIQAAHRTSDVKSYLAFGGGTAPVKLQTVEPGKSIIQSDIGGYAPWWGYLLFLQTARVLSGMKAVPIDKALVPSRAVTPENAVDVLTTGGFGTDFVNGFRKLLGLSALSGTALGNAATLNGTMTAKPGS
jgi:ribose transport system substrate-binding protein